ncbi:hypothetical protein JXL83_01790 [candidate division WOR-3 bacterium]|nr:hypothetical protein [candidate division WOR-3 bacterium]
MAKIAFYKSLLLDPDSPSFSEIRNHGLPEDKHFVRNSDPENLISHILRKAEGLEENKDTGKKNRREFAKKWANLPVPPPPEGFFKTSPEKESPGGKEEPKKEIQDEKLDEILKDFETDFTSSEQPEVGKLSDLEKTSLPVPKLENGKTKEALDVIVRTLKAEKEKSEFDVSGCESVIKSIFDRKIALYLMLEKGSSFFEAGDKNYENSARSALENVKTLSEEILYWTAEYTEESILGYIDKDFSITSFCDKKKTGIAKIELGKIFNMARKNL